MGVAQKTIDLWEGKDTSITSDSNTSNPPDLKIKELRKRQKKIALELRKPHDDQPPMSQEKVAGILGIPEGTIAWWDAEVKKDASILGAKDTCNPPDLRIKVPKSEYGTI